MKAGGKIALVGFPNAGKTTLFNALTGAHERTGNWHGVTVTARGGKMKNLPCFLYDLPGIYGEEATSPEEKVTREFLEREKDALLLIAVSANDAARGLAAAEHLIKTRKTLVVFTFYDEFSTRGGKIDMAALNAKCFAAAAVDGNDKQDVKRLETALRRALEGGTARKDFRLEDAEKLIIVPPQKKNFLDKVLFHKAGALTAFALLFAFVFYAAFGKYSPSMLLTDLIGNLGKRAADGARAALSAAPPWFSGFLCDGVLTGIFAVLGFLPQLVTLFLVLTVLEESGIMARFAFMSDGLFEKIGLNGRAFFSLFAGFGCTAVAALSTRSLDDKTLHKKTVLMLPFISCSARLPVYALIINAVFPFAKPVLLMAIYLLGVSLACVFSALYDKVCGKSSPPLLMEMPALRKVRLKKLAKSLHYYLKQFIIRVGSLILCVTLAMWFLSSFSFTLQFTGGENSMLAVLGKGLKYLFYPMGITDWRVSVAALGGIFAKEAVAGTLAMLFGGNAAEAFTPQSALAFLAFASLYTPCLSALAAIRREIGIKGALLAGGGSFFVGLFAGYLTFFLASHLAALTAFAFLFAAVGLLKIFFSKERGCEGCGKCHGGDRCRKTNIPRETARGKRRAVFGSSSRAEKAGYQGKRRTDGQRPPAGNGG